VRLTARGCMAVAVLAAGVCATAALAAPPGARPVEGEMRRRDEIDALQRQDVADALKRRFNIDVDWRTTPLDRLVDIQARAAKAADLQQRLGVSVDWQRYSWIELEALRRTLLNFERYRGEHPADPAPPVSAGPTPQPASASPRPLGDDGLMAPTFKERPVAKSTRATDPDAIIRPTFAGRPAGPVVSRDPDGVLRPNFVLRSRWPATQADPDGVIAPTFVPYRRAARLADADDLLDPGGAEDSAKVPARW